MMTTLKEKAAMAAARTATSHPLRTASWSAALAALGDDRSQQVLAEWQPDGEAVWHER